MTNTKKKRADREGSIYFDKARNRWVAQYTAAYSSKTGRPIKRTRSAATQREAKLLLEELKEKYAGNHALIADKLTVGMWLDQWFETYSKPKVRPNTADGYEHMLGIAKREVGRLPLDGLTSFELQRIVNTQMAKHYRTAQYFRTVLRMAFRRAVRLKLIRDNPADDIELPRKPPKKPFAKPTKEAREALLNADTMYYCWRYILLTEYMTGLRRSELLGLTWQDINLTEGWLRVRHSLILGRKKEGMKCAPIYLSEPKTENSKRQICIPPALCKELAAYKAQQAAMRLKAGRWEHPEHVFTCRDGEYINPAAFSSQYTKVRKKLGIRTTFHMLRHDMASRMKASRKFDFKDIQAQLGHSTVQITMDIYTHIDDEAKSAVSCWLEEDADNIVDLHQDGKGSLVQLPSKNKEPIAN